MSVRRIAQKRLNLIRTCQTCGKTFPTTADSPFMRQLYNVGGKKQKTCYFCSESCKNASYKHRFDGKAPERRAAREAQRDNSERNRRYYAAHAEQLRAKARDRYWADPEQARETNRYNRKKRSNLRSSNCSEK